MEKEQWLFKEALSFRCFFPHHLANARKEIVKFSIYGSRTYQDLLHLSNGERKTSQKGPQTLSQTFTQSAQPFAKMLLKGVLVEVPLVDIFRQKEAHRVYAITDDQSNTSIISPALPDWLSPFGLEWKYILSAFGCDKISHGEE